MNDLNTLVRIAFIFVAGYLMSNMLGAIMNLIGGEGTPGEKGEDVMFLLLFVILFAVLVCVMLGVL